jgi:hypothetical protein
MRRLVELSVFPLLSVMEKENLGGPHPVFAGGERYVSPRFAAVAEQMLRQELDAAGLGGRSDYLEFLELLGIVQRASVEYYGWVTGADESYAVLAASVGNSAVTVIRQGERVAFEPVEPKRMLEVLAFRLPDVKPAVGDGWSVSYTDFRASGRVEGSVMRRSAGARPEGARRLDSLLTASRLSVGKLYAAKRVAGGDRVRAERWLTVLDVVDGRWALSVASRRGDLWITAQPGSDAVIAGKLTELAASVS